MAWHGFVDRRGYWSVTDHPVWQCADITIVPVVTTAAPVTTEAPQVVKEVPVPVPVPAPAPQHTAFSIYEDDLDPKTKEYGDRTESSVATKSAPAPSTQAAVTWEDVE